MRFWFKILLCIIITTTSTSCNRFFMRDGKPTDITAEERKFANKMHKDASQAKSGWLANTPPLRAVAHKDTNMNRGFVHQMMPNMANAKPRNNTSNIPKRLVSISVTDSVPVKDVLFELARKARLDVEIDPAIDANVNISAYNKPISEVVDRIARQAGLMYHFENDVLVVQQDKPRIVNYRLHLLNMVRQSQSEVNLLTDLSGDTTNGGLNSGSKSQLKANNGTGDVWQVVEDGVTNIIGSYGVAENATTPSRIIATNRQIGLVSVLANDQQHRQIKNYLDRIHKNYSSQVLIEAKILEVNLKDIYRAGIDWSVLNNVNSSTLELNPGADSGFGVSSNFGSFLDSSVLNNAAQGLQLAVLPGVFGGLDSLASSVQLVENFGVTRTLSSPRLHTMNNQFAVLTFAENFVYFDVDIEEETRESTTVGGADETTYRIDSQVKTVPVGVLLSLQPSIDLERNEVTMNIRPTLSRITDLKEDPATAFISQNNNNVDVVSQVPVVEVRELDSVLRIKSGEVMVIGGLIEQRRVNDNAGIPGVSRIPIIGNAFKTTQDDINTIETVMFIKATIIPGRGVTVEDQNFYNRFTHEQGKIRF